MLKLRRLRVERFRSVASATELLFSDGINVLLGQNGTGKTTLLELISMVVRSDFSSLAKEEFTIEYELSASEDESIIVVVRNDQVATEQLQAPVEFAAREVFRPSAEILGGADRRSLARYDVEHGLSVGNKSWLGPIDTTPMERGFLWFFISYIRVYDTKILEHIFGSLRWASNTYRLDESLDLFRKVTGTGNLDGVIQVQLISSDLRPDADISRNLDKNSRPFRYWGFPDPFAPLFVPASIVRKLYAVHEPRKADYSFTHSDLDLLSTLKDMMGFSASELRVDVTEQRRPDRLQIGNLVFRFWWEDGTFITHERLSYGQKRLVAFFYYLACNPSIVIADELVNGLHHRWITAAIEAIGQRQAFLTSQNPLLLDYIPITSAAEVRRSFVLCRGEPRDGRPGWIWENMSEDDAQELFNAYGVGVEHVSEILQSRGLW